MVNQNETPSALCRRSGQNGSALLIAVFVLALVGLTGISLLFVSQTEVRMSYGGLRDKRAFYLAEAGEEDGRMTLFEVNGNGPFTDDLVGLAGANGQFDLIDPAALQPIFDGAGVLTGVTGVGDDVPVRGRAGLSDGSYMAYITNDPADGVASTADTNDRVMITAAGAGPEGEFEVVQAVVERWEVIPQLPPATITMLGPSPEFFGGTSEPHVLTGNDCGGRTTGPGRKGRKGEPPPPPRGIPDYNVPVVATIGADAETAAEAGMTENPTFTSGDWQDLDVFVDLTDPTEPTLIDSGFPGVHPMWTDCEAMHTFVEDLRSLATVICTTPACNLPPTDIKNLIFVDGDLDVGPEGGAGTLVVTGTLRYNGSANWNGMVFVIGAGRFERRGAGNGYISGAIMAADIAGPDDVYGTADDCEGGENGFDSAYFDMSGGGIAETIYCTADILGSKPNPPYRIVAFRQL